MNMQNMHRVNGVFAFAVLALICVVLFAVTGCNEEDAAKLLQEKTVQLESGQKVEGIPKGKLFEWLQAHKDVRVTSIVSINTGGHGVQTGFVIIYEPLHVWMRYSKPLPEDESNVHLHRHR